MWLCFGGTEFFTDIQILKKNSDYMQWGLAYSLLNPIHIRSLFPALSLLLYLTQTHTTTAHTFKKNGSHILGQGCVSTPPDLCCTSISWCMAPACDYSTLSGKGGVNVWGNWCPCQLPASPHDLPPLPARSLSPHTLPHLQYDSTPSQKHASIHAWSLLTINSPHKRTENREAYATSPWSPGLHLHPLHRGSAG